jgi:hypothetical protein
VRDAERENILLEWDLGIPEEEAVAVPDAESPEGTPAVDTPAAETPAS